MSKLILLAAAAISAAPTVALANAYAYSELNVTGISYTISPRARQNNTFSIFSDTAATYLGLGASAADSTVIPGTADADESRAGTLLSGAPNDFNQVLLATPGSRSDATITAGATSGTASSNAESHVLTGFGNTANASSGNRASYSFRLAAGTVVTVAVDFNRVFDLRTGGTGETATGVASITATLTRVSSSTTTPVTITGFNPNSSNSVSDGDDFALTDGGTIIFTFAPVGALADYTLNIAGRSTTDVRSFVDTPTPATLGLLGLGLFAVGLRRR